jgi:general nucleoside transport system permease protein
MENQTLDILNFGFVFSFLISILRLGTPLILAALGGLLSERSGLVQIALEGFMLAGALIGAIVSYFTGSPWLGFVAAGLLTSVLSLTQAFLVIKLKADQIVTGTALNILILGLAPFCTKLIFNSTGQTPSLPVDARFTWEPMGVAIFATVLVSWFYYKTKAGLMLQFAGESPQSLEVAGLSSIKVRFFALFGCGVLAGCAGASLSLFLASSYSPQMSAGRGFIALAALIFGRWKPWPTFAACLIFAFFEALQIRMQGIEIGIPVQFIQVLPYVITIVALAGFFGRSKAPKALGQ